tara:strand:+ start:258 stop:653 length:396 start_codon:yes stop_codon:yes gene_type:complete
MPNVKYSGSKGIVQSTGNGAFQVSGVGVSHDVETIQLMNTHLTSSNSSGLTAIENVQGARILTVPNPHVSTAAGQQKLIVLKGRDGGGQVQVGSENTANLNINNGVLDAVDDYCLLVWTGVDWVTVATNIN